MTNFKVLVSDKLSESGLAILRAANGIEVDVKTGLSKDELISIIGQYHALVIRSATKVTADVIAVADNLKVVGRAGIGVDNVDTNAASEKGIVVMNTPGGNTITTAEHAISLLLSLARNIPQAHSSTSAGKWEKSKFTGVEIYGKTLGILGIGRIGSLVAQRAHGLSMKVIAHDPFIPAEIAEKMGVSLVSLDELYAQSDFISIHSQLTDETRGMIDSSAFAKMKKGIRIINCARGGIINEADLVVAVESGQVAGAALDVFEHEPLPAESPLRDVTQIVTTPHLGASTSEAQEKVAVDVAEQIVDLLTNGIIRNAINVPSIDPEELPIVKPFIELGEHLGSFLGQIAKGATKKIEISYMGDLVDMNHKPIDQAIIKGVLEAFVGKTVNMVNAPYLAESRGIVVDSGSSSSKRNFAALLALKIVTDEEEILAEGTIFAGGEPRLTRLQDVLIEARLTGDMILFRNKNIPGVIGRIGTCLGEQKINIADFRLGKKESANEAMAIVNIDSAPTKEQVEQMKRLENVIDVRTVSF